MGFSEIIDKIKSLKPKLEGDEEQDDDVTKDRYLRSLRRERRRQMEELEKKKLKLQIEQYKKEKAKKYLWGVKEHHGNLKKKQKDLLKEENSYYGHSKLL